MLFLLICAVILTHKLLTGSSPVNRRSSTCSFCSLIKEKSPSLPSYSVLPKSLHQSITVLQLCELPHQASVNPLSEMAALKLCIDLLVFPMVHGLLYKHFREVSTPAVLFPKASRRYLDLILESFPVEIFFFLCVRTLGIPVLVFFFQCFFCPNHLYPLLANSIYHFFT